jgi:hypothetical protein
LLSPVPDPGRRPITNLLLDWAVVKAWLFRRLAPGTLPGR